MHNPLANYSRPFPNRRCRKAAKGRNILAIPISATMDFLNSLPPRYFWLYQDSWRRFKSNPRYREWVGEAVGTWPIEETTRMTNTVYRSGP